MVVLAGTFGHCARNLHHIFAAQFVGGLAERGVGVHVEDSLGDAISVTDVYERHATHFAGALHPPCQGDVAARVAQAQLAASICPIHILK